MVKIIVSLIKGNNNNLIKKIDNNEVSDNEILLKELLKCNLEIIDCLHKISDDYQKMLRNVEIIKENSLLEKFNKN